MVVVDELPVEGVVVVDELPVEGVVVADELPEAVALSVTVAVCSVPVVPNSRDGSWMPISSKCRPRTTSSSTVSTRWAIIQRRLSTRRSR